MEEHNTGMDKEVRQYFRKIINSFSMGLMWMLTLSTAGLLFKLAIVEDGWRWYNVAFYLFAFITLLLLLSYLYRVWKKK